jgi:hypothetical protein
MFPVRELKNTVEALPSATEIGRLMEEATALINNDLVKEFLAAEDGDVVEFARAFVSLRKLKDKLDELDKAFSKLFEPAKVEKLPGAFDRAGVPSVTLDEGYRVTVSQTVRASVRADQREGAAAWLRDHDMASVVTETINASTLSAIARSMLEDGSELPQEHFTVAIIPNTSVTKR